MKERAAKTLSFLRTTAIGGLIFLLPLAVIGGLLGYAYTAVMAVYHPLSAFLPVHTPAGMTLLFLLALAIVLALCFAAGLIAKRAIARSFSRTIEKQLVMVFPKYAIYKDIVAGNIGGEALAPSLHPVTVHLDDMIRIGYRAGRTDRGLIIVYFPGSPDPWLGCVGLVPSDRVHPLEVDFNETAAICERLGRNSEHLLGALLHNASAANRPDAEQDSESSDQPKGS